MFTGIVQGIGEVTAVKKDPGFMRFAVATDLKLLSGLQTGASVAIDGVCLTAASFDASTVWFDAIQETLARTNLKLLRERQKVNIERSARFGDEIGGHLLSGHIVATATIDRIERTQNNCVVFFRCSPEWTKYLLPKGYVALNGVSLTLVTVDRTKGLFSVHLIPETLERTTFGTVKEGDAINIEIDSQTQTIVDTLERLYAIKSTS